MQSAEFRVKRQALGLTATEIRQKEEVPQDVVRQWEREITPPENLIRWLEEKWEGEVSFLAEVIQEIEAPGAERPVDLGLYFTDELAIYITDRSESENAMHLGMLAMYCELRDIPYVISYIHPPNYPLP